MGKGVRSLLSATFDEVLEEYEVAAAGGDQAVAEEAARLGGSLRDFLWAAWPVVWPNEPYIHGWHVDAICEYLTYVTEGEILRLQIWIPPGSSKSTAVSIMWPAWEWTRNPQLRYISASYDLNLATGFAVRSRDLIKSDWYKIRWPNVQLRPDWDLKRSYANVHGGTRLATSVGGEATGQHGHRILIDDPLNAKDVLSEVELEKAREWHDGSISTRFDDSRTSAEVMIMQRLSELDLAAHVLDISPETWTILCLPEEYEKAHPYAWQGDPRDPDKEQQFQENPDGTRKPIDQGEGALLCPERVGPAEHALRAQVLSAYRAAGQLQQRPAPREGALLKRSAWRYYAPFALDLAEQGDTKQLPAFTRVVISWDTSFKEKTSSDYVCGITMGVRGGQRYLLRLRKDRMGFGACKTAMLEAHAWTLARWPHAGITTVIENRANGPDIIAQLRKEIPGVVPYDPPVDKLLRAEACEPDFESGAVHIPGGPNSDLSGYDGRLTPAWAQELVEECAVFPNGQHDDQVDALTQGLNWARVHAGGRARALKPLGRVPFPGRFGTR